MDMIPGKRILIVEDSKLQARITADILSRHGYSTDFADTAEGTLKKISSPEGPDLILMDIDLGEGMNGASLAKHLQQIKDVPVVFLTAMSTPEVLEQVRKVARYGYVLKGAPEQVLVSTVEMALKLHEIISQARMYRRIFEESLTEVYIFHLKTLKFLAVNRGARENLGYTMEELREMTPLDLKPELDFPKFKALLDPLLKGEQEKVVFETVHRRKDGTTYPVEVHLQQFEHMGEKVGTAVVIDLTVRRRMEEELVKSRQEYLELAEDAPIGILKCDRRGNITYVNQKVPEILGSPSIEETKKINLLTFHQMIKFGLSQRLEDCLQNNRSDTYEVHYESKWGKKVWLRVHVKPLANKNEVTGAQMIIDDITQKKRLEEENRRREERLRLMLKGIPSPAWLISRERRILAQNKAAAELFGTKEGDYCWQGIHGGEYLPKEYREAIEKTGVPLPGTKCYFCRGDEALAANEPVNSEVEFAEGVWDTWWVPQGEDVYVHYAVDVTRYKKMEEELYRLSITDPLTGVYNRRYFIQTLEQEIERVRRSGQPLSVIMADLDHFKNINDRFGHAVGDQVLKAMAASFKERLRKTDCLARWGGEEFVILLPDTTAEGGALLAEDLRRRLSQMEIPGVGHVTASFGVTGYLPGDTVDTIIQRVDDMMYQAKGKGRNCVCTCTAPPPS
ncbi:diguanylate cyclase [Neomoorella humiferrea]|uniref:GGDEF domain-containing response regulator n=1 Tax=Neomoorella humiferrea TaxID=676965 RepID=UPI003D8DEB62